jgi:transposase InsO family protein
MYDKSIVAHSISPFVDLKLVTETVEKALELVPYEQRQNLILHSDQGWHFTNLQYRNLLSDNGITQSISAKGSSVDNVPIESFFSILKSECIYLIDNLYKREIETVVNNFINYYNNERLQEKIKELTPIQFRELTLSASF